MFRYFHNSMLINCLIVVEAFVISCFFNSVVWSRCIEPSPPPHSFVIKQSPCEPDAPFTAGDYILYGCDYGYNLIGVPAIYCLRDSSWSEQPRCEPFNPVTPAPVTCPPPVAPPNSYVLRNTGTRSDNRYNVGDQVQFNCNEGYNCPGSQNIITCQTNGQWTLTTLNCQPNQRITCVVPILPTNAFIQGSGRNQYSVGDTIQLGCISGYAPFGLSTLQCTADGSWSQARLVCQPLRPPQQVTCRPPPTPPNAYIINGSPMQPNLCYNVGDFIQFGCNPGYNITGRSTIQCQSDGTWTDSSSFCCNPYIPRRFFSFK